MCLPRRWEACKHGRPKPGRLARTLWNSHNPPKPPRSHLFYMNAPRCERNGICSIKGTEAPCEVIKFVKALSPPLQIEKDSEAICAMVARSELRKAKPLGLVAASSFYIGCRKNLAPITLRELSTISGIHSWEIGRETRLIVNSLHIKLPIIDESGYVSLVLSKLNQPPEMKGQAMAIVNEARAAGLNGKNPMTLAAAAVYSACILDGRKVTQQSSADAAGMTVETVRRCLKMLRKVEGRTSKQNEPNSKRSSVSDTRPRGSAKLGRRSTGDGVGRRRP